jgi:hypothetical protein
MEKRYKRFFENENKFEEIADYVLQLFPELQKFTREIKLNSLRFFKKYFDNNISFYDVGNNLIQLLIELKVETSSISLANPRLAYQNTSARKVTYKKYNVKQVYDSIDQIKKALLKYKNKIQKDNINFNTTKIH